MLIAAEPKVEIDPVVGKVALDASGPINQIINPAGIVIETTPTADNSAIIQITKVIQGLDDLKDDDKRITWNIVGVADNAVNAGQKGEAKFLNNQNTGKIVRIYGVTEGRILVQAMLTGTTTVLADYEAIVVKQRQVIFRAQMFNADTPDTTAKTQTIADASKQIQFANIYLRQIGIQLTPDQDKTQPQNLADRTKLIDAKVPGYFQGDSTKGRLVDAETAPLGELLRKGARDKVVQIAYIVSTEDANTRGQTIRFPANPNGKTVTLTYRVTVGENPSKVTMKLMAARESLKDLWGFVITNVCGDPKTDAQIYGNTIAHELCHTLALGHRAATDNINDGIDRPNANLMFPSGDDKSDLDLIQLLAARASPEVIPL
jgi:hypothetical protein